MPSREPARAGRAGAHRQPDHPGLRPQRGRLRGTRRPARRGRLDAGRRARATTGRRGRSSPGQHLRFHRGGQAGVHRPAARRGRQPARRWSPPAASPSGTAPSWPRRCPRRRSLSFDDYGDIAARLDAGWRAAAASGPRTAHRPSRRPARGAAAGHGRRPSARHGQRCRSSPAHGTRGLGGRGTGPWRYLTCRTGVAPASGPRVLRRRLGGGLVAPLEDRIRLRPPVQLLRDPRLPRRVHLPPAAGPARRGRAGWPARACASCCWSARTPPPTARIWATCGCSRKLLPQLAAVPGIVRVRVSYLQPAEVRPGLVEVMASTPGVAPYFDLSFQHASGSRCCGPMRRFGDRERFLRAARPDPGGWPRRPASGPTSSSASPARPRPTWPSCSSFLSDARLDAIGDLRLLATRTAPRRRRCPASWPPTRSRAPGARSSAARRGTDGAAGRRPDRRDRGGADRGARSATARYEGRAAHQAPEVDGATTVVSAGLPRRQAT